MKPLPRRRQSRSAIWALRVAGFAPLLAILAVLAHRGNVVDTPSFLVLAVIVGVIEWFALGLVISSFKSLWTSGTRGGRRASWALFIIALTLVPFGWAAVRWVNHPRQVEVSSDLVDPPLFASELRDAGPKAVALVAGELKDGYPDLTGRRYSASTDLVSEKVAAITLEQGWTLTAQRGRIGADDEVVKEFSRRTELFAMPIAMVVRITDEGETTYVDVRSKAFNVPHDLGENIDLVTQFFVALDFALIGQAE